MYVYIYIYMYTFITDLYNVDRCKCKAYRFFKKKCI
jgi:hypothetical protein